MDNCKMKTLDTKVFCHCCKDVPVCKVIVTLVNVLLCSLLFNHKQSLLEKNST